VDFRVFATDASPHIVAHASRGIFPQRAMDALGAERRVRFFRTRGTAQQVRKALRQKLVFARQHLITDPPFHDLDLVICRNLIIYLDTQAMRHVVYLLHSALRTGGYLFLGTAESLPADYSGFETLSANFRIFRKVGPIASANRSFPQRVDRARLVQAAADFEAVNPLQIAPAKRNWSEELRISHEELDASREELQAVNEELRTANHQLNLGNEELNAVNTRLRGKLEELQTQSSVLSSGGIMTLFLDEQLRVRWFTPAVSALFPLMPGDVGRRITDLAPKFTDPHFMEDLLEVMRTEMVSENDVRSHTMDSGTCGASCPFMAAAIRAKV
jgi:two-component system CheB/CheR fusion protein